MKNLLAKSSLDIKIFSAIFALVCVLFLLSFFIQDFGLKQNMLETSLPPFSKGHIFGTDSLGRDLLLLTLAGTKSALIAPFFIAFGSLVLGLVLGSIAGYYGKAADFIISRYADIMISMPSLLLAIVVSGIIGGGYVISIIVMIVLFSPFDIRLIRSAVIEQKNQSYIDFVKLLKLKGVIIIAKHIFPNIAILVFVNFFLNIAYAIVSMSSLSYLGLGIDPGAADWGRQLSDGRELMFINPFAVFLPGAMIVLSALAINTIGNYLVEEKGLE